MPNFYYSVSRKKLVRLDEVTAVDSVAFDPGFDGDPHHWQFYVHLRGSKICFVYLSREAAEDEQRELRRVLTS